jgi:hypothetical protein
VPQRFDSHTRGHENVTVQCRSLGTWVSTPNSVLSFLSAAAAAGGLADDSLVSVGDGPAEALEVVKVLPGAAFEGCGAVVGGSHRRGLW